MQLVERNLGSIVEPGIPIEGLRRKIERRRIFPRAGWIVASQREFHHLDVADCAAFVEFIGLGAEHGTDALRADLHDAIVLLRGVDHGKSVGDIVRHGLLAIDVFAGVAGVDYDAPVPVIRHRGDDAVDVFAIEQFLVVARGRQAGVAGDFFRQRVAAVVQVGGADALDARNA